MLLPGGAHPLTQRFIAELVRVYGNDVNARDKALEVLSSSHLIVTGQADDSPNPPYVAEKALLIEHTAGMGQLRDTRWAQALAAAINAQYR